MRPLPVAVQTHASWTRSVQGWGSWPCDSSPGRSCLPRSDPCCLRALGPQDSPLWTRAEGGWAEGLGSAGQVEEEEEGEQETAAPGSRKKGRGEGAYAVT